MAVELGASVTHNLRNLGTIRGRDRLGTYWPYTLLVYGISVVAGIALSAPIMLGAMRSAMTAINNAASAGGRVDQAALQNEMMHAMLTQMAGLLPYQIALSAALIILLTAATVRRLHDRNWSGLWVLLPVAGQIASLAAVLVSNHAIAAGADIARITQISQLVNALVLIGDIVVFIQLVQAGSPGDNRFGPPPAD